MAVSIVAGSAPQSAGTAGTGAVSATPTLPTGSAAADRVFIIATAVGTLSTPTGFTQVYNTALGAGTAGAATGARNSGCWFIDYDGATALPAVNAASVSANTVAACAVTLRRGVADTWDAPTFTTGNTTATASTSYSVAGASIASPTGAGVLLGDHFPSTTTTASATLTQTGATFAAPTNSVTSGGSTTGNDAAVAVWTTTVTTGATAAPTHAATLGTARTGGTGFVFQTVTAGTPVTAPVPLTVIRYAAIVRAHYW